MRFRLTWAGLIAAIALIALLPATASAKKHREARSVDSEFSLTGLALYRQDTNGTALTCPDSTEPYKFEDHVRAHIAWDTTWRVRIPINAGRKKRVLTSNTQKLNGSTWSISGKELSDEECVPPQSYSCSGTFKPAAKA